MREDLYEIECVCIDYTIRLVGGQVVETSARCSEPLTYLHGHKQIVPGVEQAVEGLESGSALEIVRWPPRRAYGPARRRGRVPVVPRAAFPSSEEVGPGMMFSAQRLDGRSLTFRVVEVNDELVLNETPTIRWRARRSISRCRFTRYAMPP